MKKVLVAMSGGVDSSVTALLLKNEGYSVEGITMHLSTTVSFEESHVIQDARRVAQELDIPHHIANVATLFENEIINYFVQSYQQGDTPNPCVRCNEIMKFGHLQKEADRLGCGYFATGHYVRLLNGVIRRAKDLSKDQSYFLYSLYKLTPDRYIFPLGDLTKSEVRTIAKNENLYCADKGESQDLCFVPDGSYTQFLSSRIDKPDIPGPIVDTGGTIIGTHDGIYKYTTGQRKGLGALGKRMFVKEIRPADNTIVAAEDHELNVKSIDIAHVIRGRKPLDTGMKLLVQVRYRSRPVQGVLKSDNGDRCCIVFDEPVRAPSRGQSAVLYNGDAVLAGGIIC